MPGQIWTQNAFGGNLTAPILSTTVRLASIKKMRFRQFTRLEGNFGPGLGDTLQFKKASNVATPGRVISELETVPTTSIQIFSDSLVVQELSNSIEYTDRVEQLARLSITDILVQKLKDDMANTLDRAVFSAVQTADLVFTPQGTLLQPTTLQSTTGAAGGSSTRQNLLFDVKNIVDTMKSTFDVPFFDNVGNYVAVSSTQGLRGLKDDKEVVEAQKFGDPDRLFAGEVGRIYGTRFVEETNVLNGALAGGAGEMCFFGDDALIEIVAKAEQLQARVSYDFGRDNAIRWVFWGAFSKTWAFSEASQVRMARLLSLT